MAKVHDTTAPVPFFTDTRTLVEKLNATQRDWMPTEPEENCPAMILGLILERGTFTSKYKDNSGEFKVLPTARILTADNTIWSIIGFHGYLKSELERKNPQPGDFAAFAFTGTKPGKPGESDAYIYAVEVERHPTRGDVIDQAFGEAAAVSEPDGVADPTDGDIPFSPTSIDGTV